MDPEKLVLSAADYGIIACMLVISASIGLYFKFVGAKHKDKDEFLLAGRDMAILPVAFSLMATFMSTTTLMGIPAEMYLYGTHMAFMNIGFALGIVSTAYVFLPMYFSGQVSTAYEYLEGRFGKFARSVCSFTFIFQMILFMAVVLYAPALALSAVTNLSTLASVITIGIICTFYCTLGGIKAVLWTDVFQSLLMYLGLFAVIVTGCLELGGIANIFSLANEGGRLVIPSFTTDLQSRYTMWNILLQSFIITAYSSGCGQVQVQRMLTVKNIKRSRIAAFLSIPMIIAFHLLTCFCGVIFYAKFRLCDPLTSPDKPISSPDQLFPYYVMRTMSNFPGLPGLCICCIFSAALSTISSCINSLTSATVEDFVKPFLNKKMLTRPTLLAQAITVTYGSLCIALAFFVASIGNLVKASLIVFGVFAGPMLGIFVLAAFTTKANEKGSIIGFVISNIIGIWIGFGLNTKSKDSLPVSIAGCPNLLVEGKDHSYLNMTSQNSFLLNSTEASIPEEDSFRLSYMWTTPIVFFSCLIIGYASSLLIGCFTEKKEVAPEFLCPFRRWFWNKKFSLFGNGDSDAQPNTLEKLSMELQSSRT